VPKVSRDTASEVREFGSVTDRREEMDGYTVEFVSFAADSDLDGPLQAPSFSSSARPSSLPRRKER